MKITLTTLNAKYIHSSLALRYLQTYCKHRNISVDIAEYTINNQVADILRDLYTRGSDVVGIACYIWNIEMVYHLVNMLKQVSPETVIILGGPEVSYTAREILEDHVYIDYIVQGEGEEALAALLETLATGKSVATIPGVLGRVDNRIAGSEELVEVADLSSIPFPYESTDFSMLTHKIVYYESSRGCPFQCQYCLSGNTNKVRFFDTDRVIKELQQFVNAGVHQVKFVDRTFNCVPQHHHPLLEYMASVEAPVNFHLEIAADLLREEDLQILTTAPKGRIQLEIGIQSTNEDALRAIKRHNEWPIIENAVHRLQESGRIHLHLDLIIGLPYEDYQSLQRSFHDIYCMRPQQFQIGFLKLLKGSGIRNNKNYTYQYDRQGPYEVLGNDWLPYEKIQFLKVLEDVFERFYNSGKFSRLIEWLVQPFQDNYFLFYEQLTKRWHQVGMDQGGAVSDQQLIAFLWKYICQQYDPIAQELLKLDILSFYRFRLKPEMLNWEEPRVFTDRFWRDEQWVRRYLHDYRFTNWRAIKKENYVLPIGLKTAQWLFPSVEKTAEDLYLLGHLEKDEVNWQIIENISEALK